MSASYDPERMFSYLKGLAIGRDWHDTLQALYIARHAHAHQTRKSGEPYIIHPLTVACHLVAMGVMEDPIIATALLHDFKEDCNGDIDALPCAEAVKHAIDLVSFDKNWYLENTGLQKQEALRVHYAAIAKDRIATLVKLADRCNNVSTMAGVFNTEKLVEYIDETRTYVLPLVRTAKNQWPEYSDPLFIMKYHITTATDAIETTMNMFRSDHSA